MTDAIRRAQAWLADGHVGNLVTAFDYCKECYALARLGPASVALAEALQEILEWSEEYPYDPIGGVEVENIRKALAAWTEAVTQHADGS